MPLKKLKIGVSACLLGMKYRYDGTSKLDQRIRSGSVPVTSSMPFSSYA